MIDGKRQFCIPFWAFVSMWLLSSTIAFAQQDEERVLRIGTKEAAPFSILNEDGTWSGISIELWRGVANHMGLRYKFENLPLDEILAGVESGKLDAGVAAITITHEREQYLDFSHSYFNSGLGIAVAQRQTTNWSAVVKRIFSTVFLKIVFTIFLVLLVMGTLVYLFERRRNRGDFGGSVFKGLSSGIWWAAVTMTTVGYGDVVPATPVGKFVAAIVALVGVGFVALPTGILAAGFAEADLIVERTYSVPMAHQAYIEPQACVVRADESGKIEIWCCTQGPFMVRSMTAALTGIDPGKIKVTASEIGGGFGGKTTVYLEPVAAVLAQKSGRPVKMVMTREEVFRASGPVSPADTRVKLGIKRDGTITALETDTLMDSGAFTGSPLLPSVTTCAAAAARC